MSSGFAQEDDEFGPWEHGHRHARRMAKMAMRGRGRGRGGPPWAGPFGGDFGFGGPWGGPGRRGPWGRGPKAKRGDVRAAILALLSEEPRNGYQLIQEIAQRSEGAWRPSPGAVYPALQQLTDEGLVRAEELEGKRTFHLTDEGRAQVLENPDEYRAPWEAMTPQYDDGVHEIFRVVKQAGAAMFQVVQTGSPAQIQRAKVVLDETRRKLYQILAEDDVDTDETTES